MDRTPGSGEIIPQSSPPTHIYQGTDRPSRNMAEPGCREPTGARPGAAHPASLCGVAEARINASVFGARGGPARCSACPRS